MEKELTCKERVRSHYQSRIADLLRCPMANIQIGRWYHPYRNPFVVSLDTRFYAYKRELLVLIPLKPLRGWRHILNSAWTTLRISILY